VGTHEHAARYELAILRSDQVTLGKERRWMEQNADDPSVTPLLTRIDLYDGRLENARERAHGVNVSVGSGLSESAAHMLLDLARGEALYSQGCAAGKTLSQALQLSDSKDIKQLAARVMVLSGHKPEELLAAKLKCLLQRRHSFRFVRLRPQRVRQPRP